MNPSHLENISQPLSRSQSPIFSREPASPKNHYVKAFSSHQNDLSNEIIKDYNEANLSELSKKSFSNAPNQLLHNSDPSNESYFSRIKSASVNTPPFDPEFYLLQEKGEATNREKCPISLFKLQ